jgi:hypothetical protein
MARSQIRDVRNLLGIADQNITSVLPSLRTCNDLLEWLTFTLLRRTYTVFYPIVALGIFSFLVMYKLLVTVFRKLIS